MNSKTIIRLLLILAGLLLLWQGQAWWSNRQLTQNSAMSQLDIEVKPEDVTKILVQSGVQKFDLAKDGDSWKLDQDKVMQAKVDTLLEVLKDPKVELVSQNQDRHAELGVSDDKANKIAYFQGDQEKFVLLVSKANTKIVRQKDKQNVYKTSLLLDLPETKDLWLEATPSAVASPSAAPK